MKKFQKGVHLMVTSALVTGVLLSTSASEASWKHKRKFKNDYHRHHQYYRHHTWSTGGQIVVKLPWDFITVVVGNDFYKYRDGHYYKKHPVGWKSVKAPRGACLAELPRGYHRKLVNNRIYYVYNDVYYLKDARGYVVVDKPGGYDRSDRKMVKNKTVVNSSETITINIPKMNGQYEPVELVVEDDGFIGPQGEYYEEFPKVADLKVIYGQY